MSNRRNRLCFVVRSPPIAKLRPEPYGKRHYSNNECKCSNSQLQPEPTLRRPSRLTPSVSSSESSCSSVQPTVSCCCCPTRQPIPEQQEICTPRQRMTKPKRSRSQLEAALPYTRPPDNFAPVMQCVNAPIDEPIDPYYNYDRNHQTAIPGVDPMANFDLNRYDRDNVGQAGTSSRRRNVSIRTCVDYDYEPRYPTYSSHPPPSNWHQPYPQLMPTQRYRSIPPDEYYRDYEYGVHCRRPQRR